MQLHEGEGGVSAAAEKGSAAMEKFQVDEWTQTGRKVKDFEHVARDLGAKRCVERNRRLLCGSLSTDPYGKMLGRFLESAEKRKAVVALAEGSRAVAWELGEKFCQRKGWSYDLVEFVTTAFGEALALVRVEVAMPASQDVATHPQMGGSGCVVPTIEVRRWKGAELRGAEVWRWPEACMVGPAARGGQRG